MRSISAGFFELWHQGEVEDDGFCQGQGIGPGRFPCGQWWVCSSRREVRATPPSVTEGEMMDRLDESRELGTGCFPEESGVVLVEPGPGRDSRIFGRGNSIRHGFRMAGREPTASVAGILSSAAPRAECPRRIFVESGRFAFGYLHFLRRGDETAIPVL